MGLKTVPKGNSRKCLAQASRNRSVEPVSLDVLFRWEIDTQRMLDNMVHVFLNKNSGKLILP